MAQWNIPASTANELRPLDLIVKVPPIGIAQLAVPILKLKPQLKLKD